MERHQLEYFAAIMEHGSFTHAAAAMNVSQPALSRAIKNLERELGVELFRRSAGRVTATDAAHGLAARVRAILRDMAALPAAAKTGTGIAGRVEVAATPALSVEPMTDVVRLLRRRHPGLTVVGLPVPNAAAAAAAVDSGRCEVGLCGSVTRPSGRNIVTREVGRGETYLVVPPGSSFQSGADVRLASLQGQRVVVAPQGTTLRAFFDHAAESVDGLSIAVEVGHREAILPMVLAGVGVAFLSSEWVPLAEHAGAGVCHLEPRAWVPYWLVTRRTIGPASDAFVTAVQHLTVGSDESRRPPQRQPAP